MSDPKPFQQAAVEAALAAFADTSGLRRFLVADEVGLGKTVVAKEVARRMSHDGQQPLIIYYIANGHAVSHQNKGRVVGFLDKKNRLIADEVQQTGTVDHTPVYPREVIRRSLELSATAIILVHNHPSGDPSPSSADVQMTRAIADAATPLGIVVHDHIIIGKSGHASLRGLKLI